MAKAMGNPRNIRIRSPIIKTMPLVKRSNSNEAILKMAGRKKTRIVNRYTERVAINGPSVLSINLA